MSTSGPDDSSVPSKPPPELGGLDPKDLLNASLETVPPVTLLPRPVDSDATIPVSGPRPMLAGNKDADLPLPEELTNLLPHGNYHVESFLGQGGMGAVYKGTQIRLKRPVAIKIMRRDFGKDHDFEARFEREAQAMAKLNHPNIVSVIDFGEAGPDYLYIVMELIDGADLMDVIRGGQMTQEMALSLLPQICDALQFAHDHGIVHRDIKPSNIMVTRDGRVKMADFGLAKHFDTESSFRTQTGTGMGTPDYAAPEQFSANTPIDHRADIYALGVMIYQMITGQLPRGAWKPPSLRAEVDPHWDDIVSRAMQNDPADRYQQASEVKTDVSSIPLAGAGRAAGPSAAASGPASANHPSAALGGPSAPPKSRAPLVIGLVAGAAVLTLGLFFMLKKPGPASTEVQPADSMPAPARDASDAKVSLTNVTASSIQWQEIARDVSATSKSPLAKKGDWYRIVAPGGTFGLLDDESGPNFKNVVVRYRIRLLEDQAPRLKLNLSYENLDKNGKGREGALYLQLNDSEIVLDEGGRQETVTYYPGLNLKGTEADVEFALVNQVGYARINGQTIIVGPIQRDGFWNRMSLQIWGDTGNRAEFSKGGWAILDGLSDPLKALGWEVATGDTTDPVHGVAAAPAQATREVPFVNTLGMKFVPVPITGGPTDGKRVLFSIWETRVKDYQAFANATKAKIRKPTSFELTPDHPIINVSWGEATAFCEWLTAESRRLGRLDTNLVFRLPTDHEWSCAVGIGNDEAPEKAPAAKSRKIQNVFPWGSAWPPPQGAGNFRGQEPGLESFAGHQPPISGYDDGFPFAAPVALFEANHFGLFDLGGNVAEWCMDFVGAKQGERDHVYRGMGWGNSKPEDLWSSARSFIATTEPHHTALGFRVVMGSPLVAPSQIPEVRAATSATVDASQATKEVPFTNTLGMKFVPVPITGGPTDGQRVLFSVWETREQDYEGFARETKRERKDPGFDQAADHPAVNVSWDDATAFCEWLTQRERQAGALGARQRYRLPGDHEWSCAVGIGNQEDATKMAEEKHNQLTNVFPWSGGWPPVKAVGNFGGEELQAVLATGKFTYVKGVLPGYRDEFETTSPVGSFPENSFGIHDLSGNVSEWCDDWFDEQTTRRAIRGGGWVSTSHGDLRSTYRTHHAPDARLNHVGFRCVLSEVPAP